MWTILPLKALSPVKTRLAPVLDPEQRSALMRAMVADVLSALAGCPSIEGVLLVTRDEDVSGLAAEHGATVLSLDEDTGLNSAVEAAANYLASKGAERAMILHGDIPLANAPALERLVADCEGCDLALLPCRRSAGTKVLISSLPARIAFCYGPGSFERHLEAADEGGIAVRTIEQPELALDVNTPEDLRELVRRYLESDRWTETHTYRYLAGLDFLHDNGETLEEAKAGQLPGRGQSKGLALVTETQDLVSVASALRDRGHGSTVTYSRKVFIPLTMLCRDVCHYCTYAKVPKKAGKPYMSVEEAVEVARRGAELGCAEALLTLGDKPEARYKAARDALAKMGFETTLEYVAHVARAIYEETGLLPHVNAGNMDEDEVAMLRRASPSMGIMLESASGRLCEKGMPHFGSPDKAPRRRIETMENAGRAKVPFTSGILIGIGETRLERVESLLALRNLHERHGHIQEVIIQNFRAKPDTLMAEAPEPDQEDLVWTIAVARIILGAEMSIQAPPNLVPGSLEQVIEAGINDLGGISPLTPDYVNPEAPWPHLEKLESGLAGFGRTLAPRLTLYPEYVRNAGEWVADEVRPGVLRLADGEGFAREDGWLTGVSEEAPAGVAGLIHNPARTTRKLSGVRSLLARLRASGAGSLAEPDIARLFAARGDDFSAVCQAADRLRAETKGDAVSYVVNRNINYTNICYFKCRFCAFSKGKVAEDLREKPYDLAMEEIQRRTVEARGMGATEVCLQGGIHPNYTGQHYIDICRAIKAVDPDMHIHAFSPLEVWQGAETLGIPLPEFLERLREAGLASMPGTAAEILHDDVRRVICADKINTAQWLEVMETAHESGLRTTATVMFGHVDRYEHWARHLLLLRELQARTGGFTEFVPLPFVADWAPMYRRGESRRGPTFRESVLMHAVARLVLHPHLDNIQASWVKLGKEGVQACLHAGANDVGGTLINESITRSAGASHGQYVDAAQMRQLIVEAGRTPWQRTTLYQALPPRQVAARG